MPPEWWLEWRILWRSYLVSRYIAIVGWNQELSPSFWILYCRQQVLSLSILFCYGSELANDELPHHIWYLYLYQMNLNSQNIKLLSSGVILGRNYWIKRWTSVILPYVLCICSYVKMIKVVKRKMDSELLLPYLHFFLDLII